MRSYASYMKMVRYSKINLYIGKEKPTSKEASKESALGEVIKITAKMTRGKPPEQEFCNHMSAM